VTQLATHLTVERGTSKTVAAKPGLPGPAPVRAAPPRDVSTRSGVQRPQTWGRPDAEPGGQLAEHFSGIVEAIEDGQLRVRVKAASGDDLTAWLPLTNVPESERRHARLGAPIRVAILDVKRGRTLVREHRVRFPRAASLPGDTQDRATDWLLQRMRRLVAE
jgi:hypothetical protein